MPLLCSFNVVPPRCRVVVRGGMKMQSSAYVCVALLSHLSGNQLAPTSIWPLSPAENGHSQQSSAIRLILQESTGIYGLQRRSAVMET